MPELHYRDYSTADYLPRMGGAFSDAVTGMMRLKLAQQQREDERARNMAEFQLARERLQLESQREGRESGESASRMKLAQEAGAREQALFQNAQQGADAFGRLYGPPMQGPSLGGGPIENDARNMDIQNIARSLAFARGTSASASAKALELPQFNPGPVYDPMTLIGPQSSQPRPMFVEPQRDMSPYQQGQLDLRGQQLDLQVQRMQQMNDMLLQRLQLMQDSLSERTRHDKVEENKDPIKAQFDALMRKRLGGTNAPASTNRFTIVPDSQ
jgi:hypothetical protein